MRKRFYEELVSFCSQTKPVNADYLRRAIEKLESRTDELMKALQENMRKWSDEANVEPASPPRSAVSPTKETIEIGGAFVAQRQNSTAKT